MFDAQGQFDVVYSWGVLHHTAAMWKAIDHAAGLVKPGGLFAIALYQKTPACGVGADQAALFKELAELFSPSFGTPIRHCCCSGGRPAVLTCDAI